MNQPHDSSSIVYTRKASCRDCHRCVRACPVKAIRIVSGQASVVEERCIHCGTCIRECPQRAKTYRTDVDRVREWIGQGRSVAVSIAPSFAALFEDWERKRLPSVLRRLGFSFVAETAVAAEWVADRARTVARSAPGRTLLWTSCPAVIGYLETQRPDLVELLLPVATPMVAHGRAMKGRLGADTRTVFIGPCVAKKAEALREPEAIDAVLTFEELLGWMEQESVGFDRCEESGFDEAACGDARWYPLEGGSLHLAGIESSSLAVDVQTASGADAVSEALEGVREVPGIVELLFCKQGCIAGPAAGRKAPVVRMRRQLARHAGEGGARGAVESMGAVSMVMAQPRPRSIPSPTEAEIQQVLERTGKSRPEDQLDCGACGYGTCRAKAIAVIQGMADPAVCIPMMRRLAEQRSDRIMDTSPNGILILDQRLNVLAMNPAFRALFRCTDAQLGTHVSALMDPEPFQKLAAGAEQRTDLTATHRKHGVVCREILYKIPDDQQLVGIFINITQTERERESLAQLRRQTMAQGRELLEHQIEMAQQLTRYLGESTAKGETLLQNLLKVARDPAEERGDETMKWLWDIYTSKS